MGFHFTIVNATGKLLEKLYSQAICMSICIHISDGCVSLESNYTHMASWFYLYYVKSKAKFEGVLLYAL